MADGVVLIIDKKAMKRRKKNLEKAQNYVDEQCTKRMRPYVPVARKYWRNAGRLRDSMRIASPGVIVFTAPKARHDYNADVDHSHGGNPQGKKHWFEYMKQQHKRQILRGTAKIMGGKAEE